MGEKRSTYTVLVEEFGGRTSFDKPGIDGRIILK
jgi:hypothetical protein